LSRIISSLKKSIYTFPFLVLAVYLCPYIIWGKNSFVYSHDNLDGLVATYNFLANNGHWFSSSNTIVGGFMNGLPRVCYGTEFYFQYALYYLFSPFVAYVLNVFIVHIIAIIGSSLLLKNYLLKNSSNFTIQLVSLCFGLLPFWYAGGLSIAAQPLVIYAFLNIYYHQKRTLSYALLALYCIYSVFFWAGIFFIFAIISACFIVQLKERKFHQQLSITVLAFASIYALTEYRIISEILFGDLVFHRSSYLTNNFLDTSKYISKFIYTLKYGHYQSLALHYGPFILFLPFSIYFFIVGNKKPFYIFIVASTVTAILIFFGSKYFEHALTKIFHSNHQFNISRINTLLPLTVLLVITLIINSFINIKNKRLIYYILVLQVGFCFYASANFNHSISDHLFRIPNVLQYDNIHEVADYNSFNAFYAEDLYSEIKAKLYFKNEQPCNVACVGIHPSQLLYNGISTINGYMNLYPQSYKESMLRVNENYVNGNLKGTYNLAHWGNRCYMYNPSLENKNKAFYDVNYNFGELRKLNCAFIFSAFELQSSHLLLIDKVSNKQRKIFVYQLQ